MVEHGQDDADGAGKRHRDAQGHAPDQQTTALHIILFAAVTAAQFRRMP
ncbi:MAG: hypothetical protein IPO15_16095 [Anaerolineae bacterium]|nr:hypothetical protein [Anaerolineae bacterium]